eukprot:CAMPEP_0115598292 /NCGR_PEP_ID=MMETSP0272-20121206/13799_1 /TAXON_ID=71861 /ORGANISM="Scrippsiella trochoidea, Strain CCMP3099" /LENGTH=309 /DNA_ID=CAMNT_0003033703 /DNA_START=472 /DNA_END=1398 /DNA_ORIENTATION=-
MPSQDADALQRVQTPYIRGAVEEAASTREPSGEKMAGANPQLSNVTKHSPESTLHTVVVPNSCPTSTRVPSGENIPDIATPASSKVSKHSPEIVLQILTTPSAEPVIALAPSDENIANGTWLSCSKVNKHSPRSTLQIFAVPSRPAVSTLVPSGDRTADKAPGEPLSGPSSVRKHLPELASQIFAVKSREKVSACAPSGEKTADTTWSSCPASVLIHSPDSALQTFADESRDEVMTLHGALTTKESDDPSLTPMAASGVPSHNSVLPCRIRSRGLGTPIAALTRERTSCNVHAGSASMLATSSPPMLIT